ncbi:MULTISPECIES: flagellar hook-associated protein 3 [Pseudomonas]|uniref:Flagellar hook-associated protein 3 n=1 Tax=Pseudomonas donghuensis TaxID=1163398 RepID=A0AAP0XHR2_9PSED|nr:MULTISPECIES: flagellar hook-associated protein 3 [Pseudomonas]MBS7600086.1 flagellar hook-associated protein 3 [Pseudomonas sp. RC2C2]MDF9892435.1 flagellar hook-associated protein 3 FlgL [Pseudomonas vranovensis]KDO00997.1 flagellar hook-associated protein 3 [Pseudomonas donghuensis]MCP6692087.1 flagellar hook-associated protein 3 [Pseudomonas donghuensis]MCP6695738.1 flagellar hook-associated protein 3 [Pseudomonas donghuensis]
MRISTAQFYNNSTSNYQRNFAKAVESQQQASDMLRIRTAADDPVGAARLLQLEQQSNMIDQYSGNIASLRSSLSTSETTLTSITNVLARVKELAISSGSGNMTDKDRLANAQELTQLEEQLFSLMNSRDENGKYIFSGSRGDTKPFERNADGTYSYKGDQGTTSLQVGDMLSVASNESGYSVFEQALNTSRSQTTMTAPTPNDGRVSLSNGQVSGSTIYNDRFRSGEPYTIEFTSSTQFKVTDAGGNDVTLEASKGGTFDPKGDDDYISFRGVDLRLGITFKPGDEANPDAAIAGHTFTLGSKPDEIGGSRSPGNTSMAQLGNVVIGDKAKYDAAFPGGGAVIKFKTATTFDVYAQPMTADSRPLGSGDTTVSPTRVMGVDFSFSGAPATGDQFSVQVNNHQNQNVLDTIKQLRTALESPVDKDPVARQNFLASMDSAIANLASAADKVAESISSVGGRGAALDVQAETNEALQSANTITQSSIREADPAEVLIRLNLQQNMLQASQLAFSKLAGLGLFNRL